MPLQPCRRAWVITVNPLGGPNDRATPIPPSAFAGPLEKRRTAPQPPVPACCCYYRDGAGGWVKPVHERSLKRILRDAPSRRIGLARGATAGRTARHQPLPRPTLADGAARRLRSDSLHSGRAVIYSDTHRVRAEDVAERSAALAKVHFWCPPCPLGPRTTREQGSLCRKMHTYRLLQFSGAAG